MKRHRKGRALRSAPVFVPHIERSLPAERELPVLVKPSSNDSFSDQKKSLNTSGCNSFPGGNILSILGNTHEQF